MAPSSMKLAQAPGWLAFSTGPCQPPGSLAVAVGTSIPFGRRLAGTRPEPPAWSLLVCAHLLVGQASLAPGGASLVSRSVEEAVSYTESEAHILGPE